MEDKLPQKPVLQYTVDIPDRESFYEDIVNQAASQLLAQRPHHQDSLRQMVADRVSALLDGQVSTIVNETMQNVFEVPLQRYDILGKPCGDPVSLKDMISNNASKYMSEKVDSEGKRTESSYATKHTRIDWLVYREVVRVLEKEMRSEIELVKQELLKKAKEAASQVIAGFKVKI